MPKTKLNCHDWSNRVRSMTKTRKDNNMTDRTGAIYSKIGTELSWSIEQDVVYHKSIRDNDVIDRKSVIFIEYDTKLSRLNGQCVVYDEDEIRQWCDRSYCSTLRWKQNCTIMTDSIGHDLRWSPNKTMTWLVIQVWCTLKSKLNCHD